MNAAGPLRAAPLSLSAGIGCAEQRSAVRIGTSKAARNDPIFYGRGIPNYYSEIVLKSLFFHALVRAPFCRSGGAVTRWVRALHASARLGARAVSKVQSKRLNSLCVAAARAATPISFIARRAEDVRPAEEE